MNKLRIFSTKMASVNQPSKQVSFPLSDQTLGEIKVLKNTFRASLPLIQTLGLSACQIGVNKQFFIIPSSLSFATEGHNPRILKSVVRSFVTYFNPKILSKSEETKQSRQLCLSIPSEMYWVTRSQRIEVQYCDQNGASITRMFSGERAMVFQHQYDHLQGITINLNGRRDLDIWSLIDQSKIIQFVETFQAEEGKIEDL